jgi:hypothetical protein
MIKTAYGFLTATSQIGTWDFSLATYAAPARLYAVVPIR